MSYQVIARKYRPQRFADVVGQEHVTQTLANAINKKRIAHAYLFVGPRGTGKTTIARIFAKALNATGGPMVEFPDDDPRVKEITEGRSLDVLEIDGASNRGIEEIRELRDTVKYAPSSSRYKIYIIDEVHMLTKEAFNALLKTLEEPPEHVKFMFATTEPEKVLATILSRCQRFDLRRIPANLIVAHLGEIASKEGVHADQAALHAIARGSEGCMRDAESTLDQLISFCGNEIVESDVLSMFGLAARGQLHALAEAMLKGDVALALQQFNELAKSGKDLARLIGDLLNHFRNLLIFQVAQGDTQLLDVSENETMVLKAQATLAGADALARIMEILTDCESRLRDTASKKILIEVSILKAVQARKAVNLDAVLEKIQQLRREASTPGAAGASAPPTPTKTPPSPPASITPHSPSAVAAPPSAPIASKSPIPPPAPTKTAVSATPAAPGDLSTVWKTLVESADSRFVKAALSEAQLTSVEAGIATITFDRTAEDNTSLFDGTKEKNWLTDRLTELGYRVHKLNLVVGDLGLVAVTEEPAAGHAPRVTAPPRPAPKVEPTSAASKMPEPSPVVIDKEQFKNDPLIKKALETFKGQIVEVKMAV